MSNHKTPSIRFKGFTDDWEQRKLGNVIEIAYQGINTTADKVEYVSEGVPILQGKHITSGKIDYKDVRYLDKEKYESVYYPKYVPKVNDILLANIGTIGPLVVMKPGVELLIAWNIMLIRLNKMGDVKFVKVFLDKLNNSNFYESIMRGNATKFINKDGIMSIEIPYPTICEQEKIGAWFEQLDNLITLHQRKYEKLVNVKKSMLDKMFPKNDFKVPEIRFKGFTDDWEQRKVSDLLELLTDYDANGSFADMARNVNTTDGTGYAWYVRMTDLENPKPLSELKYVDEASYKFLKKTELHGGELLMAKRGNIGKAYIFEPRTPYATVAPNMYLLKLNDKVIPHFLYNYFISSKGNNQLVSLNASSTMGALYKDDVKNINVIMPSIEEQQKIGEYFSHLDNLITLHQRELEKLQNLKKSLLNSMFI